jgi:hypothetical protein
MRYPLTPVYDRHVWTRRTVSAAVTALSAAALVCATPAAADPPPTWPPGRYTVPDQMPYGTYQAATAKRGTWPGCVYSTWATNGTPISYFNGAFSRISVVQIIPEVGAFESKGCTDWVKIG